MSSSTASAGSKRPALQDKTLHSADNQRVSKRLKPARTTSQDGDQETSKYFKKTRIKTKGKRNLSEQASESDSASESSTPKTSQRKNRSISPPASSRHVAIPKTAKPQSAHLSPSRSPKRKVKGNKDGSSALVITEHIGDIFDAPTNALLIHACNCKGHWGKGVALSFKKRYPEAFKVYAAHCQKPDEQILGKALLIPPQPGDVNQHFVGCVFTSAASGKCNMSHQRVERNADRSTSGGRVDSPHKILNATGPAVTDLLAQARSYINKTKGTVSELRMCKSKL